MDVKDFLGGQYLCAENVTQPLLLTIQAAHQVQVDEEPRVSVTFAELEKPLLCNKTNLGVLCRLFGTDTVRWIDQKVVLQSEPVSFQGRMVNGLRVKPYQAPQAPQKPTASAQQPAPQNQVPQPPHPAGGFGENEVPF